MRHGNTFRASARLVEAFRGAWSDLDESYSDEGVALDFIRSLEPRYGPTVVRVSAPWHSVAGDWLCEYGEPAVMVPRPQIPWAQMGEPWAASRSLLDAWEWCDLPQIMVRIAADARAPVRCVVGAAAAFVRSASWLLPQRSGSAVARLLPLVEAWASSDGGAAEDAAVSIAELERAAAEEVARLAADWATPPPVGFVCSAAHWCAATAIGERPPDVSLQAAAGAVWSALEWVSDRGVEAWNAEHPRWACPGAVPTPADLTAAARRAVPTLSILRPEGSGYW